MAEDASPSDHAARCRALCRAARVATLATIARDPAGFPYASLVTVAADELGRPLLLLSRLAEHTQNLAQRADASILLIETNTDGASPLSLGRFTLLGPCAPVPEAERAQARAAFLAAHPDAARYVDFADFAIHRLEPIALRYVGGFGRMSWVDPAGYLAAGEQEQMDR